MTNLIIISFWTARSAKPLFNLLRQMDEIEAGLPFEIAIICNSEQVNVIPFYFNFNCQKIQVFVRQNQGLNIGAWDYGWRKLPSYDNYLFLQDDCFIVRRHWLKAFVEKFYEDSNIGLLGESIYWKCTWEKLAQSTYNDFFKDPHSNGEVIKKIDFYRKFLLDNQIAENFTAEHLQSTILFTSRKILEKIDGFINRNNYREAIACEIAISKKVQGLGYQVQSVNPNSYHHYIAHPQWLKQKTRIDRLICSIRSTFKSIYRQPD